MSLTGTTIKRTTLSQFSSFCKELETDYNKSELIQLAIELGLSKTQANNLTKRELCRKIATTLVIPPTIKIPFDANPNDVLEQLCEEFHNDVFLEETYKWAIKAGVKDVKLGMSKKQLCGLLTPVTVLTSGDLIEERKKRTEAEEREKRYAATIERLKRKAEDEERKRRTEEAATLKRIEAEVEERKKRYDEERKKRAGVLLTEKEPVKESLENIRERRIVVEKLMKEYPSYKTVEKIIKLRVKQNEKTKEIFGDDYEDYVNIVYNYTSNGHVSINKGLSVLLKGDKYEGDKSKTLGKITDFTFDDIGEILIPHVKDIYKSSVNNKILRGKFKGVQLNMGGLKGLLMNEVILKLPRLDVPISVYRVGDYLFKDKKVGDIICQNVLLSTTFYRDSLFKLDGIYIVPKSTITMFKIPSNYPFYDIVYRLCNECEIILPPLLDDGRVAKWKIVSKEKMKFYPTTFRACYHMDEFTNMKENKFSNGMGKESIMEPCFMAHYKDLPSDKIQEFEVIVLEPEYSFVKSCDLNFDMNCLPLSNCVSSKTEDGIELKIYPKEKFLYTGGKKNNWAPDSNPTWFGNICVAKIVYSKYWSGHNNSNCYVLRPKRDLVLLDMSNINNIKKMLEYAETDEERNIIKVVYGYNIKSIKNDVVQHYDGSETKVYNIRCEYDDKKPEDIIICAFGYYDRGDLIGENYINKRLASIICKIFQKLKVKIDGWMIPAKKLKENRKGKEEWALEEIMLCSPKNVVEIESHCEELIRSAKIDCPDIDYSNVDNSDKFY